MNIENNDSILDSEINISSLFFLFWKNKLFIVMLTVIFAVSSVFFALSLQPIYSSKIALKSVQENEPSFGEGLGVLSGITKVQGSLGLNPDVDAILAMRKAVSRDFFKVLYKDKDFKKNLLAYESFNPATKANTYDETIYDTKQKVWLYEPYFLDAHKKFTTEHMSITKEKVGGFVNITIEHKSPIIAAEWAELIYKKLNVYMKSISVSRNTNAINFLKSELNSTKSSELKEVIASSLERKIQKAMYANISDDYIFSVVDSAYIPHERSRPSRAFICIMITIIGFSLSCLIVFVLDVMNRSIQFKYPYIVKSKLGF
jgi:LPS O-antigen subunit length determinant protein (WzzB/FepE family)